MKAIPTPAESNPEPKVRDRWFNYRSLQYIYIDGETDTSMSVIGESTLKRGSIRKQDFTNTRWFKHHASDVKPPSGIVTANNLQGKAEKSADVVAAIRDVGAKLDRLIELWESSPKATS